MKRYEKAPIQFSDGRRGIQGVAIDDDGHVTLLEIVVTRTTAGRRTRVVYGPRRYLEARVFSFADLGEVTWETCGPAKVWQ